MAQQGDSDTGNSKPRDRYVITAIKSGDFKAVWLKVSMLINH